jgi:RimJ/RimL family protein N-acetyltransferase
MAMLTQDEIVHRFADLRVQTERLALRRFEPSDLDAVVEYELDPRIMRYIRDPEPRAAVVAKVQAFLRPWSAAEGEWAGLVVARREAPEAMVGVVALRVVSRANGMVEIGYTLHPDAQGRGYALEACRWLLGFAFGELRAHKAIANCVRENQRSFRLMEKLGMQREGCLREHSRLGGRWHDELVYGLLAAEWRRGGEAVPPSGAEA